MRGTGGALTGAITGVSLARGRSEASPSAQRSYAAGQRRVRAFVQEFGAPECHALLGCDLNTPEVQPTLREDRLSEHGAKYTGMAAAVAAGIISENNG